MSEKRFQRWKMAPKNKDYFSAWYKEVYPRLLSIIFSITQGERQHAEDALQDAIVRFLDRIEAPNMSDEKAAMRYIVASARNRWRDMLRKQGREGTLSELDLTSQEVPIDYLLLEERIKELEVLLDESEFRVFEHIINGESLKDISKMEKISYSNAGVQVHRIREKVRKFLNN